MQFYKKEDDYKKIINDYKCEISYLINKINIIEIE